MRVAIFSQICTHWWLFCDWRRRRHVVKIMRIKRHESNFLFGRRSCLLRRDITNATTAVHRRDEHSCKNANSCVNPKREKRMMQNARQPNVVCQAMQDSPGLHIQQFVSCGEGTHVHPSVAWPKITHWYIKTKTDWLYTRSEISNGTNNKNIVKKKFQNPFRTMIPKVIPPTFYCIYRYKSKIAKYTIHSV